MSRRQDFDVAIVGGGIVGASAALALRRHGKSVVLLERDVCGSRSSGVNYSGVRRQGRSLVQLPLSQRAHEIWGRLPAVIGIEGEYIPEVTKEINYFMRDWRSDDVVGMDPRNYDIVAATHRLLDVSEPYTLLSGYRSPSTNAMLRSRSGGVAKNSLHMKGMAADLRLKSRSVSQMAKAAEACSAGGVGHYYGSNFVHMDCGAVRHWGG